MNASEKQFIATSVQTFILNEAPVREEGFDYMYFFPVYFRF